MRIFVICCLAVLALVACVALAFSLKVGGLEWDKYFGPKTAAVQREVFKAGRSYNEAKVQALIKHRREYVRAPADEKEALASLIRMEFAEFYADGKAEDLPDALREFLVDIMDN